MWHVSSRSGVATLRTAVTYLLTFTYLLAEIIINYFVNFPTFFGLQSKVHSPCCTKYALHALYPRF